MPEGSYEGMSPYSIRAEHESNEAKKAGNYATIKEKYPAFPESASDSVKQKIEKANLAIHGIKKDLDDCIRAAQDTGQSGAFGELNLDSAKDALIVLKQEEENNPWLAEFISDSENKITDLQKNFDASRMTYS